MTNDYELLALPVPRNLIVIFLEAVNNLVASNWHRTDIPFPAQHSFNACSRMALKVVTKFKKENNLISLALMEGKNKSINNSFLYYKYEKKNQTKLILANPLNRFDRALSEAIHRGKNGGIFRMAVFGYTHCLHSSPYNIERVTGCLANCSSSCTESQRNQVTAIRALAKSNGYVKDWEVMPANEPAKKRFTLVL
ncbi:hypothetical protein GQX74_014946 [Glossina fuscipes]|nr:hypothetical protein GQX74_014946 [Glossina fuscipes]